MKKLRVWWIPQIPGKPFYVPVNSLEEAKLVLDTLAAYDLFQLKNNIKPDYANAGGLQEWEEEGKEWVDWYDEEASDDFDEYCENHKKMLRPEIWKANPSIN
jgi:hypothetical protein